MNDSAALEAKSRVLVRFNDKGAGHINCAQTVLVFALDLMGQDQDMERIAHYFGGGMNSMGEVCGAITGALLALGVWDYRRGASASEIEETKATLRAAMREFAGQFGACRCRELTGFDVSTPEGFQAFKASEAAERCQTYVSWMIDKIAPLVKI
jgi:C_GCAxxG_C_C family probable redox protein